MHLPACLRIYLPIYLSRVNPVPRVNPGLTPCARRPAAPRVPLGPPPPAWGNGMPSARVNLTLTLTSRVYPLSVMIASSLSFFTDGVYAKRTRAAWVNPRHVVRGTLECSYYYTDDHVSRRRCPCSQRPRPLQTRLVGSRIGPEGGFGLYLRVNSLTLKLNCISPLPQR